MAFTDSATEALFMNGLGPVTGQCSKVRRTRSLPDVTVASHAVFCSRLAALALCVLVELASSWQSTWLHSFAVVIIAMATLVCSASSHKRCYLTQIVSLCACRMRRRALQR